MARKSAGRSNGRDSNPKYLGIKRGDSSLVKAGTIIVRQRGTKIHAGTNVGLGRDHTLYSLIDGKVSFEVKNNRKYVSVYGQ